NNTQFLVVTAKQVLEKLKSQIAINSEKDKLDHDKGKNAMFELGKKVHEVQAKVENLIIVKETMNFFAYLVPNILIEYR
ncbi:22366_t:CDS:2, partial [Dentiscutata erythropus]